MYCFGSSFDTLGTINRKISVFICKTILHIADTIVVSIVKILEWWLQLRQHIPVWYDGNGDVFDHIVVYIFVYFIVLLTEVFSSATDESSILSLCVWTDARFSNTQTFSVLSSNSQMDYYSTNRKSKELKLYTNTLSS